MADDHRAVSLFQEYLRIPSVQPDVDYSECVTFLVRVAKEFELAVRVIELIPKKPFVLMTISGGEPNLPSILLNSHMDVVPVYPELWTYDPFSAEIDETGKIYARGSQDCKCIGIQYMEAIHRLVKEGKSFKRTTHILFVPDEEEGRDGVENFVTTTEFREFNIGFVLDERIANDGLEYLAFYAEKSVWQVTFRVSGTEGHGSLPLLDTPGEKLITLVMNYRKSQLDRLTSDRNLNIGDVTFVNLTMIEGGKAPNVVPPTLSVTFDFRLAVNEDQDKFERILQSWITQAGGGISIEYIVKETPAPCTSISESNVFWSAMKNALDEMRLQVVPSVLAGATDSRFFRKEGIMCIAFSPMNQTPDLSHCNNEYLNKEVFLRGIDVYCKIISHLANV